jgi:hypothetical protein
VRKHSHKSCGRLSNFKDLFTGPLRHSGTFKQKMLLGQKASFNLWAQRSKRAQAQLKILFQTQQFQGPFRRFVAPHRHYRTENAAGAQQTCQRKASFNLWAKRSKRTQAQAQILCQKQRGQSTRKHSRSNIGRQQSQALENPRKPASACQSRKAQRSKLT